MDPQEDSGTLSLEVGKTLGRNNSQMRMEEGVLQGGGVLGTGSLRSGML